MTYTFYVVCGWPIIQPCYPAFPNVFTFICDRCNIEFRSYTIDRHCQWCQYDMTTFGLTEIIGDVSGV